MTSLRMRLGPFPNELDAVRSIHKRQEVATPDDHSDVMCAQCYIFDEPWPCTVARLIEVIDAQIASESALSQQSEKPTPSALCGNCQHPDDIHSPVNAELCAVRDCPCPGYLTVT